MSGTVPKALAGVVVLATTSLVRAHPAIAASPPGTVIAPELTSTRRTSDPTG